MNCQTLHAELVRKSKLPKDLVTKVKTPTCPCVISPKVSKSSSIMKAQQSESVSETFSQTHLSLLQQTLAKLELLFDHEQESLLCTTTFPSAKVNSSVKHSSATQCSVPASAQLSSALSATVPIADDLSVGDLADTSSHLSPQRDVQAAGITLLERGEAVAQEELFLEDLSYTTQGSLMAEQPRAPSASSLPPIPNLGAAALAQGGGPHLTGNHFKPLDDAHSSLLMSGLVTSHPRPSLMTDADPSYTLASTCSDAVPSVVEPLVQLPSNMPSPVLSSVPLSNVFSSKVPITSHVSASDPAEVVWFDDDFTPSHYRHLNPYLSYGYLPHSALFYLGSWPQPPPAPTSLFLEALDEDVLEPALLEAAHDAL